MTLWDRVKADFWQTVQRITSRYDYAIPYTYEVVAQNSDGSLELKPESPNAPNISHCPVWWGEPGVTNTVSTGARCLVMFGNADPGNPMVLGWIHGHSLVTTLEDGTKPMCRAGDLGYSYTPVVGITVMPGMQAGPFPVLGQFSLMGPMVVIMQQGNSKILG
jgi:hypothetical protein